MTIHWFVNDYTCEECNETWRDEWSCMCNDRCPECGKETCPADSVDLSRTVDHADYLDAARSVIRQAALKPLPADASVVVQRGGALIAGTFWISETETANYATERLERG